MLAQQDSQYLVFYLNGQLTKRNKANKHLVSNGKKATGHENSQLLSIYCVTENTPGMHYFFLIPGDDDEETTDNN